MNRATHFPPQMHYETWVYCAVLAIGHLQTAVESCGIHLTCQSVPLDVEENLYSRLFASLKIKKKENYFTKLQADAYVNVAI